MSEFKSVVNEAVELILNYEDQFSHSRIQILNDLKDTSTNASGEAWKATIFLVDVSTFSNEFKVMFYLSDPYLTDTFFSPSHFYIN